MIAAATARAVFEALPDATAVLDAAGQIVATNIAWRTFSIDNGGTPESTGIGVNYLEVCDRSASQSSDARLVATGLRDVLAGVCVENELEYHCPAPDKRRWFSARITALPGAGGGALVSHRNITNGMIADRDLRPLADVVDPLTAVASLPSLEARVRAALAPVPARSATPDVGITRIRLDGYTEICAEFGQDVADETLQALAHRLSSTAGKSATVARVTRTTFAVLAAPIDPSALSLLAERLEQAAALPHLIHGTQIDVATSIDTCLWRVGDDATEVLNHTAGESHAAR